MNAVSCILYLSCYLAIIAVYCASLIANVASLLEVFSCAYLLLGDAGLVGGPKEFIPAPLALVFYRLLAARSFPVI